MGRGTLVDESVFKDRMIRPHAVGTSHLSGSAEEARNAYNAGVNPFLAYAFGIPLNEIDRLGGGPNTAPFGGGGLKLPAKPRPFSNTD